MAGGVQWSGLLRLQSCRCPLKWCRQPHGKRNSRLFRPVQAAVFYSPSNSFCLESRFKGNIKHVFSSPFLRCIETSDPIAATLDLPLKLEEGNHEFACSESSFDVYSWSIFYFYLHAVIKRTFWSTIHSRWQRRIYSWMDGTPKRWTEKRTLCLFPKDQLCLSIRS